MAPKKLRTLLNQIKGEMRYFESFGQDDEFQLPNMLGKLHKSLKSVPVSSVEVERLFSASGCFVTPFRAKLSDVMVNAMCVIRFYLLKQEEDEKKEK